jgi:hypothetical protein
MINALAFETVITDVKSFIKSGPDVKTMIKAKLNSWQKMENYLTGGFIKYFTSVIYSR